MQQVQISTSETTKKENDLISDTLKLAEEIQYKVIDSQSSSEKEFGTELKGFLQEKNSKELLVALTDRAFRSSNSFKVASEITFLVDKFGIPPFLTRVQKSSILFFIKFHKILAPLLVKLARVFIKKKTKALIVDGDPKQLKKYLLEKKKEKVKVNLNHLGEAILGEGEAKDRLQTYLSDVESNDVEAVSIKISTLYSQIQLIDFEGSLEKLLIPLRELLRKSKNKKLITLDMEEFKDLELTVALFKKIMKEEEFLESSLGIVLQSYIPDSFSKLFELTEFAKSRCAIGGAPLRVRLVKGANLSMEIVESSLHSLNLATYSKKVEVDANFKKMVEYALDKENAPFLNVGIGSHNLFDISYAYLLAKKNGTLSFLTFEMLQGMATTLQKIIREMTHRLILYAPTAKTQDFQNALAYLVRRFDENTGKDNFLKVAFNLTPKTKIWETQVAFFKKSFEVKETLSLTSNRTQNRLIEPHHKESLAEFKNEADTDLTRNENRKWAKEIFDKWKNDSLSNHPQKFLSKEEVLKAIERAYKLDDELTYVARERLLKRIAELLRERRADLIGAMMLNVHKPFLEADSEVSEAIDFVEYARFKLRELHKMDNLEFLPKGVITVASPWNFPLAIPTSGIINSLSLGNKVLFKPAEEALLVGSLLAEIISKAIKEEGILKSFFQLVVVKDEEAIDLIKDERVASVVLTGATSTAEMFIKERPSIDLMAETGGKNSIIVTSLADRDLAVQSIVKSAFGFSGQKCSACSVLILEEEVYKDPNFKKQLLDAANSLKTGSPFDPSTKVPPLIKQGQSLPEIVWDAPLYGTLHQTELFKPHLLVFSAKNLEEAIDIANHTPFGLTAGLQSLDEKEQALWLSKIEAGNCYINRGITGAIVGRQPFGGTKKSAFGLQIKVGGPNTLFQFAKVIELKEEKKEVNLSEYILKFLEPFKIVLNWSDFEKLVQRVKNYKYHIDTYFSKKQMMISPIGQENALYYKPHKEIFIRVDEEDQLVDVLSVSAAAKLLNVSLKISTPSNVMKEVLRGLDLVTVESEPEFIERIKKASFPRVRFLDIPSKVLMKELSNLGISATPRKPLSNGRLEILNFVREVSVSYDYHRYGKFDHWDVSHA